MSDFKQQKLEKEAQKNWDLFYKRNSTNFFKDRHWTTREFEELRSCREVGWGFCWPWAIFIWNASIEYVLPDVNLGCHFSEAVYRVF